MCNVENSADARNASPEVLRLASCIDQTLLSPTATEAEVSAFCTEAAGLGFASVCINPLFVPLAAKILRDSAVRVCTVIDFPLGAGGFAGKFSQAMGVVQNGAQELDFVVDLSMVKAHEWNMLAAELTTLNQTIKACSAGVWKNGTAVVTKLILETCFLSDGEITESCLCAKRAGFDFVKTSTGFALPKDAAGKPLPNGADSRVVRLMRETVGADMGVKASGGIRCLADARAMLEAGANRLGTSSGVKILKELENV